MMGRSSGCGLCSWNCSGNAGAYIIIYKCKWLVVVLVCIPVNQELVVYNNTSLLIIMQ